LRVFGACGSGCVGLQKKAAELKGSAAGCWVEERCLAWVLVAMRSRVSAAVRCSVCCRVSAAMGCGVIVATGNGTGMILRIATARDVAASAGSGKAMAAPAVRVAPVGPGTNAEEDAVIKVAGTVVAVRYAGIGCVVVVAPLAPRRRAANDSILRAADGNAN
jgi:hypothetical protein